MSVNPFPGKVEVECWSNFQNSWSVYLLGPALH